MKLRVLTAVIGIPLLLAFIYFDFAFDTPWFTRIPLLILIIGAATILGAIEFYRLGRLAGAQPASILGIIMAALFVVAALFDIDWATGLLLIAAAILPAIWLAVFRRENRFMSWSWTLAGILYMGWMLGHYVSLRQLEHGREFVILAIFSTFACDTTAFFVGRTWGKHHMAPRVSPKKTWEGAVGGFVGTIAAAILLRFLLNLGSWSLPLNYWQTIAIGCILGVGAQLGDLLESLLKRRAGAKDSGNLLPGHGGILDRIDSLVFAGVIVYYSVLWVV